ncbi:hypothetical protein ADL19_27940 [Streptomyces purpurogeneiscleroticus]|nr:hypothetical protein ADL19_27940 [Streptomyces purpurogeneiscleroticus]
MCGRLLAAEGPQRPAGLGTVLHRDRPRGVIQRRDARPDDRAEIGLERVERGVQAGQGRGISAVFGRVAKGVG